MFRKLTNCVIIRHSWIMKDYFDQSINQSIERRHFWFRKFESFSVVKIPKRNENIPGRFVLLILFHSKHQRMEQKAKKIVHGGKRNAMVVLCHKFIRSRLDEFRLVVAGLHPMGFPGLDGTTLQLSDGSGGAGLLPLDVVGLDASHEILTALWMVDVLHADVDLLRDNSCPRKQWQKMLKWFLNGKKIKLHARRRENSEASEKVGIFLGISIDRSIDQSINQSISACAANQSVKRLLITNQSINQSN